MSSGSEGPTLHFTYQALKSTQLFQGDILKKTEKLGQVLKDVHPYWNIKEDYHYLMVTTQSCDLEKRDGVCKARYINLAAVRPIPVAITKEIEKVQTDAIDKKGNFVSKSKKGRFSEFLAAIINNNHTDYFFLHKETQLGLADNYVAFLRLTIPIKCDLHYQTCLEAKIGQLNENFRAKLGWLTGNLYSRVATSDWDRNEAQALIEDFLKGSAFWVDGKKLEQLREKLKGQNLNTITEHDLHELIGEIRIVTQKEKVIESLRKILESADLQSPNFVNEVLGKFANSPTVKSILEE